MLPKCLRQVVLLRIKWKKEKRDFSTHTQKKRRKTEVWTVFLLLVLKLISSVREHTYAITHIRTCTEAHCKLAGVLSSACLKKNAMAYIKKKAEAASS